MNVPVAGTVASATRSERAVTRRAALPVLRLAHLWLSLPVIFVFSYAASVPITHADLFYMMMNGRLMAEFGQFPVTSDPFTYAPADPVFFNQPWIAQILYWAAERLGGFPGIILAHALAVTTAFALLTWLVKRLNGSARLTAALVLFAFAQAASNFSVRPQSFALLPFVATLALLRGPGVSGRWSILGMGILSAAWSNLHGTFPLGVAMCGLHLVGAIVEERSVWSARIRRFGWLTLAAFLGTLFNPAGPLAWFYAWRAGVDPTNRQLIWEWQPLSLSTLTGQVALATLPVLLLLLVLPRRRPRPTDVLLVAFFAALGLATQRAVIWYGIAGAVALASHLGGWDRGPRGGRERPALNLAIGLAAAMIAVLSVPWLRSVNPLLAPELQTYLSRDHPTGAADYLQRTQATGRIFARMEWGGYLEWKLWPNMQVFLDARVEQHPPAVWQAYFGVLAGSEGWQQTLDRSATDYLLLEREPFAHLVAAADASPTWRRVYDDELSVLYVRTG